MTRPERVYSVKEIFYTLQGEGVQAGRPAVFCRFAGCNLWSGREQDRAKAICRFCDTDFRGTDGPGRRTLPRRDRTCRTGPRRLARRPPGRPFVVCTGGEPLLQLDAPLIAALHAQGFEIAVETNGTRPAPPGIDWLCVSPKADAALVLRAGDELKLVYPQAGGLPRSVSPGSTSATSCSSPWMGRTWPPTPNRPSPTAWPIPAGG